MAVLEWRAPEWVHRKFTQLTIEIQDLDPDSDLAAAIRDEMKSLPGYPHRSTEQDFIRRINTEVR